MPGAICLQGGAEFGPACLRMDADLVALAPDGPVVLVALAARPGSDYASAAANGVRHFSSLGADAVAAPDYRSAPQAALDAVDTAGLVVLPGGSPGALRESLFDTPMGAALAAVLERGGVVMGASAGAMVLAELMWLPDRGGAVVPGLGLVTGVLVVPHYAGRTPAVSIPAGIELLGLPECSGVIVRGEDMTAVGARPAIRIGADGEERTV